MTTSSFILIELVKLSDVDGLFVLNWQLHKSSSLKSNANTSFTTYVFESEVIVGIKVSKGVDSSTVVGSSVVKSSMT